MNEIDDLGEDENNSPFNSLRKLKLKNINRLVIGQININSIRHKFDCLKTIVRENIDILVITETKLNDSFPTIQFAIEGYALPFRYDRKNAEGGGVLVYVREDIPCKEIKDPSTENLEGITIEINLRKTKWLLFGGYNNNKVNIDNFLGDLGSIIDRNMSKLENFLIVGDFNSELKELSMSEFCDTYNLRNLVVGPTCFKNPLNPSSIDVMLTNQSKRFQNSINVETGLSDHHIMTVVVMKSYFPKQAPLLIRYRDFKKFNNFCFREELQKDLCNMNGDETYDKFQSIFMKHLNKHAPMKNKYVRANNAPFMNKTLCKAFMNRSRLRNKFIRNPCSFNKKNYNKQRNFCVNLLRKEKKKYYGNLDLKKITDNKTFWKTMKPFFSEKSKSRNKITLVEGDTIISEDIMVAETMNMFFSNVVKELDILGYEENNTIATSSDDIENVINKFKSHPSIIKIKENVQLNEIFSFPVSSEEEITEEIKNLNINKPTTLNNIPSKVIVENNDICSPFISKIYNDSIIGGTFPELLKMADVTPAHKKEDPSIKENYRPVSILPSISKIFEKTMYKHIYKYMNNHLSEYLCGFRAGYSTQYCLILMLEKWKKALDKREVAGALLTDLSKAFDCLNHELLIAKLDAYGFDYSSLSLIFSYLSGRKQRTKINNAYSTWSEITTGIPQGSIIGPLLFNIYLNDIFYFVNENSLTNYADDNTPYAIHKTTDNVINNLQNDTNILIKWFTNNYLKMNADKCHLLITNHDKNVSATIDGEIIEGSASVKLLGIKIDNKLNFNEHVSNICKKVSLKLHALARISHLMDKKKLRNLMKAFIESQFGYCPLIWMFHSRALNTKINRLHERALRLVYKDNNMTFQELLNMDKSFTIHERNLQKLAIEMYKAKNKLSPSFMNIVFPPSNNPYEMRNDSSFKTDNIRTVYNGTETLYFRGPKTWALIPHEIRNSSNLCEFKSKIKQWKPKGCMCRICKTFISNLGFI